VCAHLPAFRVEVRDTTAAGDTFNAGLAVALSEGQSLEAALHFANAAAAISVTRLGAQASAPSRVEVDTLRGGKPNQHVPLTFLRPGT
jgi:ribokinase